MAPVNIRNRLETGLVLMMIFLAILSTQAWLAVPVWWLNLFSHFIPHYLALQMMILIGLLLLRGPQLVLRLMVLGMTSLPNLLLVADYQIPDKALKSELGFKLLHLNVYAPNTRYHDIAAMIRAYDPDVVDLMEYTEDSRKGLEATGVFKSYAYRFTGQAHLGLYSRLPLKQTELVFIGPERVANFAQLRTRIQLKSEQVTLILAHPQIPFGKHYTHQSLHFSTWIQERDSYGSNLIIAGDLNTTPWSPHFRQLIRQTKLRDSQKGFGLQPSWPAWAPWLGIPIDHVLLSQRLHILQRKVGPDVGSDHLPVFVELSVPRSKNSNMLEL